MKDKQKKEHPGYTRAIAAINFVATNENYTLEDAREMLKDIIVHTRNWLKTLGG